MSCCTILEGIVKARINLILFRILELIEDFKQGKVNESNVIKRFEFYKSKLVELIDFCRCFRTKKLVEEILEKDLKSLVNENFDWKIRTYFIYK